MTDNWSGFNDYLNRELEEEDEVEEEFIQE